MIDVDIKVAQKSAAAEAWGAQGDNVGAYFITHIHANAISKLMMLQKF